MWELFLKGERGPGVLILQGLVWPAAAGNVAWSLATLILVEAKWDAPAAQLLVGVGVLLALSLYLTIEWVITERRHGDVDGWYVAGDLLIMLGVIAFAITFAAQARAAPVLLPAWVWLGWVFFFGSIGHALLFWGASRRRWLMTGVHGVGVVLLAVLAGLFDCPVAGTAIALLFVIVGWVIVGSLLPYRETPHASHPQAGGS